MGWGLGGVGGVGGLVGWVGVGEGVGGSVCRSNPHPPTHPQRWVVAVGGQLAYRDELAGGAQRARALQDGDHGPARLRVRVHPIAVDGAHVVVRRMMSRKNGVRDGKRED